MAASDACLCSPLIAASRSVRTRASSLASSLALDVRSAPSRSRAAAASRAVLACCCAARDAAACGHHSARRGGAARVPADPEAVPRGDDGGDGDLPGVAVSHRVLPLPQAEEGGRSVFRHRRLHAAVQLAERGARQADGRDPDAGGEAAWARVVRRVRPRLHRDEPAVGRRPVRRDGALSQYPGGVPLLHRDGPHDDAPAPQRRHPREAGRLRLLLHDLDRPEAAARRPKVPRPGDRHPHRGQRRPLAPPRAQGDAQASRAAVVGPLRQDEARQRREPHLRLGARDVGLQPRRPQPRHPPHRLPVHPGRATGHRHRRHGGQGHLPLHLRPQPAWRLEGGQAAVLRRLPRRPPPLSARLLRKVGADHHQPLDRGGAADLQLAAESRAHRRRPARRLALCEAAAAARRQARRRVRPSRWHRPVGVGAAQGPLLLLARRRVHQQWRRAALRRRAQRRPRLVAGAGSGFKLTRRGLNQ
mmetsp:Transcript_35858/g.106301  ORF Transcript_35858/g.106301 Transcript_35858/m.106301 type:complete len:474 (-) Transcript_35858:784-2205(-)